MSTKKNFKRIALAVASALTLSFMSVVPAQAAFVNTDVEVQLDASSIATGSSVSFDLYVDSDVATGDKVEFSLTQTVGTAAAAVSWKVLENYDWAFDDDFDFSMSAMSGGYTDVLELTSLTGGEAEFTIQLKTSGATAGAVYALQVRTKDGANAYSSKTTLHTMTIVTSANEAVAGADCNWWSCGIDAPFRVVPSQPNVKTTTETTPSAISATSVVASGTDLFKIYAIEDTQTKLGNGTYRYVEVSGSTIAAVTGGIVLDGAPNVATKAFLPLNGQLESDAANVWVNAATAGTVTIKVIDRALIYQANPFLPFFGQPSSVDTVLQTITLTVGAAPALSAQQSTSYINALHSATTGIATSKPLYTAYNFADCDGAGTGTVACDQTILAPSTANGTTAKAVIEVNLKDATGTALETKALPAIGASIAGPGTLSISTTADGTDSVGRSLSATAAPASTFYINVFSDGTSGSSTVSILVGGGVWATKTLKFYSSTVSKITATQGRFVLAAGEDAGCTTDLATCLGTTVANTVAASVVATDANGIPVPFVKYTETSSDATVLTAGNTTAGYGDYAADYLGASWFDVQAVANALPGKTATITYTSGTLTQVLTYAIGGAADSASLTVAAGANIGEKGTFTFNVKDAAGNKAYDNDHSLAISTNLQTTTPAVSALKVVDGKGTVSFFNPVVPGTVNLTGLIDGELAVSASWPVASASADAATDAALEAIDAANAATDAANLAAEAADAATVAAEEARDAADAATAAVEALATEVATLIATLKAQITTLANTVAKIAKKVKA